MFKDHKDRIKEICDIMGKDIDDSSCQEVLQHIEHCPSCKVYYDTLKKTVFLCQENDCLEKLPDEVNQRLMEVLDLKDNLQNPPKK